MGRRTPRRGAKKRLGERGRDRAKKNLPDGFHQRNARRDCAAQGERPSRWAVGKPIRPRELGEKKCVGLLKKVLTGNGGRCVDFPVFIHRLPVAGQSPAYPVLLPRNARPYTKLASTFENIKVEINTFLHCYFVCQP